MIKEILECAKDWPESALAELAQIALEIEGELQHGTYTATPDEVAAIERGLKEADKGRFTSESELEAVLTKYRH